MNYKINMLYVSPQRFEALSDRVQALEEGGSGGDVEVLTLKVDTHIDAKTNPHAVTKAQVGLGNVDNTADTSKPVSTATQTALNGKANTSHTHTTAQVTGLDTALAGKAATVHTHTKDQVGLGNVDNTSDLNKPVSTATEARVVLATDLMGDAIALKANTADVYTKTETYTKAEVDALIAAIQPA
jgi:hypothetical protein